MSDEIVPLSDIERIEVELLVKKRRSVAHRFAGLAALATALVGAQVMLSRGSRAANLGIVIATSIVMGVLVYFLGYKPAMQIAEDVLAGKKLVKKGKVTRIQSEGNAYGESITTIWMEGDRFLTRSRLFDRIREGAVVTLYILPISRFAIGGEVHQS